jgi:Xaa-Pro dipeptidase
MMDAVAIRQDEYGDRVARLRAALAVSGIDGVYVSSRAGVAYLTSVALTPHERLVALVVPRDGEPTFLVPALEATAASAAPAGFRVVSWDDAEGPWEALRTTLVQAGIRTLALEKDAVTVRVLERLQEILGSDSFPDGSPLLVELRLRKSPGELALLDMAADVLDACLEDLPRLLRPGVREADVAFAVDELVRRHGGEGNAFDTIVLGGPNSALPHGKPGARELRDGDLVIADFGAIRGGYCADVTRTFAVGEPGARAREIHAVVAGAQEAGVSAVFPGVSCSEVDRAARQVIEAAGYGEFFVHRTGHGLGLEVHEPPSLVAGEELLLEPGMVVTVEPGIYLPDFGGVRIEDDVAVGADGAEVLTTATRDLVVVPGNDASATT